MQIGTIVFFMFMAIAGFFIGCGIAKFKIMRQEKMYRDIYFRGERNEKL